MHKSFNSRSNNSNTNNRPHTCIIANLPETLMEVAKLQDQPSCMLIQYSCLQYTQVETETHASDCRMEPVLIDWVRRAKYLVLLRIYQQLLLFCATPQQLCVNPFPTASVSKPTASISPPCQFFSHRVVWNVPPRSPKTKLNSRLRHTTKIYLYLHRGDHNYYTHLIRFAWQCKLVIYANIAPLHQAFKPVQDPD